MSLLAIQAACAQTIPMPSVPEFSVKYVDRSYYVPPVYGIDQYSGKNVQTGGGFTVTNKTLEITIMSQSFNPYVYDDGKPHSVFLRWDIAYKGHFGDDWKISKQQPFWNESSRVIVFGVGDQYGSLDTNIPAGPEDKIDFKVRARIGYDTYTNNDFFNPNSLVFHGETSEWSNIQTITIPSANGSPTAIPSVNSSSSPSPTVPEFPLLTLLPLFLIVLPVALVLKHRRTPRV
jgi:hypothetical protein